MSCQKTRSIKTKSPLHLFNYKYVFINTNMKNHESHHNEPIYTCPMHPEVRGNKGDKCPKCGMNLVATDGGTSTEHEVDLQGAEDIKERQQVELSFRYLTKGEPMPLELSHEKKVHLMAFNENLTWFAHLHPLERENEVYTVLVTFPFGGKYYLFSDLKPKGGAGFVDKKTITVAGNNNPPVESTALKLTSQVDGLMVKIENGDELQTKENQGIKITVEKAGEKLKNKDIQPYLGANAHIALVGTEDKMLIHIHPMENEHYPIYAETHFENPGIYRMWVEFKTSGIVHTADFTLHVKEGKESGGSMDHSSHSH